MDTARPFHPNVDEMSKCVAHSLTVKRTRQIVGMIVVSIFSRLFDWNLGFVNAAYRWGKHWQTFALSLDP